MSDHLNTEKGFSLGSWISRHGLTIVLAVAIAAAGFLIIRKSNIPLGRLLPFAGLLLCPLMHVFMHHGHGEREAHRDEPGPHEGQNSHRHHESEES